MFSKILIRKLWAPDSVRKCKKHDFFNFGAIFRPDLFILTEVKMASIDLTDKKLHAYQFSDQYDNYSSLNHRKPAGNSLKFQNQAYIDPIKTVKAFWKMCFLDFDVKNIPIACLIPIFRSSSAPLKDLWSNICTIFAKNRKFWNFDRIFLKNGWSDFFKILVTCSPYVILLPQKNCIFKSILILEIYGLERKKRCEK